MTMPISDEEILAAFREDMDKGGRLLFARYYRPLLLFADTFMEHAGSPEDIVQDIFYHFIKAKVYQEIDAGTLATYLFKSVKHGCMNALRDRKPVCGLEMLKYEAAEEEALSFSPELVQRIRKAVEALPEKTRLVVREVVVASKSYKETALQLDVSVNTVKTLLSRGLKELRRQFPDPVLFFALFNGV